MASLLSDGIERLGLNCTQSQHEKLTELLVQLLKWNQAFNLTAVENESDAIKLHLLDSLSIVPFWRFEKTLDVGTGAGFPGLPLAIALPDQQFHLLDSNSKKIRFIRQQVHHLGLSNVKVFHSRVQEHRPQAYSAILSRAFASISDMVTMTDHLVQAGGRWMAMKGSYLASDLASLPDTIIEEVTHQLQVPGLDAERCLIELKRRID